MVSEDLREDFRRKLQVTNLECVRERDLLEVSNCNRAIRDNKKKLNSQCQLSLPLTRSVVMNEEINHCANEAFKSKKCIDEWESTEAKK